MLPSAIDTEPQVRRILVGVDESENADDALALADVLAAQTGASSMVVTVPAGRVTSTADELSRLVRDNEADVLVLGPSHRTGLGRLMPGALAGHLTHRGDCAVAIAPRGFARTENPGLRVIGVGFDGSAGSRSALALAEALARASGGALRLFCVVPANHGDEQWEGRASMLAALAEAAHALPDDVRALPVTLSGDPRRELLARCHEVELMVVGSRGFGRIERAMLGSISEAIYTHAPCPVLVVPEASS